MSVPTPASAVGSIDAPIPAPIAHAANEAGLGPFSLLLHPNPSRVTPLLTQVLGPIVLAIAGIALLIEGSGGLSYVGMLATTGGLAVFFGTGLAALRNLAPAEASTRVYLYEGGVVGANNTGLIGVFRWDTVQAHQYVTFASTYARHYGRTSAPNVTLVDPRGARLKVTNTFVGVNLFAQTVQQQVTRAQLPAALAALEAGETLRFGPLSLNREGIDTKREGLIAWRRIRRIEPVSINLLIRAEGTKAKAGAAFMQKKVPNYGILSEIARRMTGR
jgi:hypothetical protein